MLDSVIDALPDSWHDLAEMAALPIAWIPRLQHTLVTFFFESASPWSAAAKCVFLLFPVLLALAGVWCLLEAGVLAYAARSTMTGVIAGVLGPEDVGRFAAPILYVFLFVLVAGSFACLQSFVNAVRRREMKFLAQMALIQVFVMFFEAMFFYREVVRAMAPWLMEQAGIKLSLTMTLLLAAFGGIGVRAV